MSFLMIAWENHQNLDWTYKRDSSTRSCQERSIDNKSDDGLEENRQLEMPMHTFIVMAEHSS